MKSRLLFLAFCILVAGADLPQPFNGHLSARDVPLPFDLYFDELPPPNAPVDRSFFVGLERAPMNNVTSVAAISVDGQICFLDLRTGVFSNPFFPLGPDFRGPISFTFAAVGGGNTPDTLLAGPMLPSERGLTAYALSTPPRLLGESGDPSIVAGGLRVAAADVDADGAPEIILASGPGGSGSVTVAPINRPDVLGFGPFGPDFRGGVFVSAGDLNGDGKAEIIATQETGGGELRVFDVVGGQVRMRGLGRPYGHGFTGGIRTAVADLNNDGKAEIIVAPVSGPPRIKAFSVSGLMPTAVLDFLAAEQNVTGGVSVAAGYREGKPLIMLDLAAIRVHTILPNGDVVVLPDFDPNPFRQAVTFLTGVGMFTPLPPRASP